MNTRIRVRSPRNRSVIGGGASEKFVAERRTRHDGGDTAEDGGGHVQPRPQVVTVVQQRDALVTERTHGGECATETDCESRAHVRRNDRRSCSDPEDEAEQEGAADVDDERAQRETARGARLDPPFQAIARERSRDPAERDIEDCHEPNWRGCKLTTIFRTWRPFASLYPNSVPPRVNTRRTSPESAP